MNSDPKSNLASEQNQSVDLNGPSIGEQPSTLSRSSTLNRKPLPWVGVVIILILFASAVTYFITQRMDNDSDNMAMTKVSDSTEQAKAENSVETTSTDPVATANPYSGWNTFTSRIEGFSFQYPVTMEVKETLPTDKNVQGYELGYTTIEVKDKKQGSDGYAFRITDSPWGCAGPDSWSLTYDVSIGEQATTLTESCSGLIGLVKLNNNPEGAVLMANTQYLLEDKGDFDLVLSSMKGISVRE